VLFNQRGTAVEHAMSSPATLNNAAVIEFTEV
jgi:hypothetical protein